MLCISISNLKIIILFSAYKNENFAFHNILKQVFHETVKYEGHLMTRLLIKMDSRGNMKTKSNIKDQNKILKCKESK